MISWETLSCMDAMNLGERLEVALTPRRWTREMSDAWHRALPDVNAAFSNLLEVATNGAKPSTETPRE